MPDAMIRRFLVVPVAAFLVVACSTGGGGTTTGPASPQPTTATATTSATTEPSSAAPTADATAGAETPAAATPAASTPPAGTPAATAGSTEDIEALMPTEVGGITLASETIDTGQFMDAYPAFAALLGVVGKTPADVSIVQAQGSNPQTSEIMTVQAFRVAGADSTPFMDAMLDFWKVTNDVAEPITIGDKQLIVLGSPETDAQYKTYYYPYGDVIFRLGYNGDNFDEQMAALVSALP